MPVISTAPQIKWLACKINATLDWNELITCVTSSLQLNLNPSIFYLIILSNSFLSLFSDFLLLSSQYANSKRFLIVFCMTTNIWLINQFVPLNLRDLISPHLFLLKTTSQMWCNMPRKFIPVKEKQRQKVGRSNWLINTLTLINWTRLYTIQVNVHALI